tara:strand:- start:560 stop:1573 length:1014 start_codon:yes stop_codon:yes gene_type:complete
MEPYIIDYVTNNILKSKKKIGKQISLLDNIFGNAFRLEISEQHVMNRIETIKKYQQILKNLLNLPKIEQRSEEWYNVRQQLITASDFAQAVGKGKFGTQNTFYKNKCGYETNNIDFTIPALQWGVRHEEVANMFYKLKMNVEVYEFGILRHPNVDFLGASPDGISDMGIMLEIKCPWKRKKTETIPEQYYYQIQGQLEVCDLDECDYLECYIVEYMNRMEMMNDKKTMYKGIIYEMENGSYEYGNLNDLDFELMTENYKKIFYYGIKDYFLKRVLRDKEFFKGIQSELKIVWDNVKLYRSDKMEYDKNIKPTRARVINKRPPPKPVFMFRECENDKI